jgi:Zn-dependent peptidase ImmA (M78 family)
MKLNYDYGTKERLFDLMGKLNEGSFNNEKSKIIDEFIEFVDRKIELKGNYPQLDVIYKDGEASKRKSFGGYYPDLEKIDLIASKRNLADVLRTLAHEMVHHKQNIEGRLKDNSGDTGSDIENEANSLAGIILREYGKLNPRIYEIF